MKVLMGEVISLNRDDHWVHFPDGAICWDNEVIVDIGLRSEVVARYTDATIIDKSGCLILPGFIDCHLHFPQYEIMGSYGEELLGWLNKYTFPEEISFNQQDKAEKVARNLINNMLSNGTTCGVFFSSSSYKATQVLFKNLATLGLRGVVGKVAMDRFSPEELIVLPEDEYTQTKQLISEFHNKEGRLTYALTPRFAPTCTEALLEVTQKLRAEFPDLLLQTHYAENKAEIEWVQELFPQHKSYLEVYNHYDLLGDKTLLAHCIHVEDEDLKLLQKTKSKVVHCPTSNLFLGSGLFPYERFDEYSIDVGFGSDIGAGTKLSIWSNLLSAYEIQKMRGKSLSPKELFKLATLDSAKILGMQNKIGALEEGMQVDLQIIDPKKHKLLNDRFTRELSVEEKVFSLISLCDDRATDSVVVAGEFVCY